MELKEALREIKSSENIIKEELKGIGAYPHKRLKDKYNCPACGSRDNLGIHLKNNGEWKANCFSAGCSLSGDKNIIDVILAYNNLDKDNFYNIAKDIASRNNIFINNSKMTDDQKLESKKRSIKKDNENKRNEKINNDLKSLYEKGNLSKSEIEEAFHLENELDKEVYTPYKKELLNSLTYNKNGTISVNQLKVGNAMLKEYDFINNERFFYKYNKHIGLWEKFNKQGLSSLITKDIEEACNYWSESVTRGITSLVFNKTYGNIQGEVFDQVFNKNPYNIVFKNGTLNLKNGKFENEFYKDDFNTIVIPHNYIEDAEKPLNTFAFLNMITDNIEEIGFIFEWIGYLLVKSYPITKMLFLVGDGGNGKSTLIKLMTAVVGKDNTSAVSMKSLVNNRFQTALLYNKLFNTVADIGADFFDDNSILKALTGDDTITIERKGENGFPYLNFAKMTYSCNKLPKFKDTSGGLERRPIVLNLNKDFMNIVKDSGMHINDIIQDEEEIEKIINYSVYKFMQVMKNNNTFTESQSMKQAKAEWLNDDPLVDYIGEVFDITGKKENIISMADFMTYYKNYCIDRNYKPLSQKNVIEAINSNKQLLNNGIKASRMNNKSSKYKVQGLIKNSAIEWNEI